MMASATRLIWTTINCTGCGMKIRSDDPSAMKNFILSIQNRANELKVSSGDGQQNINGKRVSLLNVLALLWILHFFFFVS